MAGIWDPIVTCGISLSISTILQIEYCGPLVIESMTLTVVFLVCDLCEVGYILHDTHCQFVRIFSPSPTIDFLSGITVFFMWKWYVCLTNSVVFLVYDLIEVAHISHDALCQFVRIFSPGTAVFFHSGITVCRSCGNDMSAWPSHQCWKTNTWFSESSLFIVMACVRSQHKIELWNGKPHGRHDCHPVWLTVCAVQV
jgi:hypothetical protein